METKSSLLLHTTVLEVKDADKHYVKQLPHDPEAQKEMMEKVGEEAWARKQAHIKILRLDEERVCALMSLLNE